MGCGVTSPNTLHRVRRLKGAASPKFAARKENSFEQKLCTLWCVPFSGQIERQTSGATETLYNIFLPPFIVNKNI